MPAEAALLLQGGEAAFETLLLSSQDADVAETQGKKTPTLQIPDS